MPLGAKEESVRGTFEVFPNPSNANITIRIGEIDEGLVQIKLFNLLGELVEQQTGEADQGFFEKEMHIGTLSTGVYMLEVLWNGNIANKKIVKN